MAGSAPRAASPTGWRADLLVWPSPFETMIGRLRFRIVGDLPLLEARVRPLRRHRRPSQAGVRRRGLRRRLLVVLAPVLAARGGARRRDVPRRRVLPADAVGRDGRPFELWKLRTMREGAEIETGAVLALPGRSRG